MTSASRLTGWPSNCDASRSSYAVRDTSQLIDPVVVGLIISSFFFSSSSFLYLVVDKLELSTAIDTFDAHGLRAQNDKVIDIPDMVTVLRSLYDVVVAAYPGEIRLPLIIDLCLNWILNVYDR